MEIDNEAFGNAAGTEEKPTVIAGGGDGEMRFVNCTAHSNTHNAVDWTDMVTKEPETMVIPVPNFKVGDVICTLGHRTIGVVIESYYCFALSAVRYEVMFAANAVRFMSEGTMELNSDYDKRTGEAFSNYFKQTMEVQQEPGQ